MFAKTTRLLIGLAALIIASSMAVPIGGILGIIGSHGSVSTSPDGQVLQAHPRSVDYRWYDMFNVPFGEWWHKRWEVYHMAEPLSNSYPFIFKNHEAPLGNNMYMSNMRLDIAGGNMTEINMNSHPEFLPYLGTVRGGNATIVWYMQYLTEADLQRYPNATSGWNDGWLVSLNGTVIMDQRAAESVLGIDSGMWGDVDTWWANNNASVSSRYIAWLVNEGGPNRLDIYPMYEWPLTFLYSSFDLTRIGNYVFLSCDLVTWGIECLMTRWLHEAFMPTEWYFEDMAFIASIGPEMADLDISTAVAYALYAYEPAYEVGQPCWVWEAMLQDCVPSTPPLHPNSTFDPYAGEQYLSRSPGSVFYRQMVPYDYTPGAFNLSANETMTFEWPAGPQLFKVHDPSNFTEALNYTDEMIVDYTEPMHTDDDIHPGSVTRDNVTRELVFTGPIDMWTWSRDQTAHQFLADEWTRLDMLPYGIPYIEFEPEIFTTRFPASLQITDIPDRPVNNTPVNVTVTVLDNVGDVYPDYAGTVHFWTDRPAEVDLPADYTFVPGSDAGTHTFVGGVNFHALGNFTMYVQDLVDLSISGFDVAYVLPEVPHMDRFVVSVFRTGGGSCLVNESNDIAIIALDQFGTVYADYAGTVTFLTNASVGKYILPPNYTFTPAVDNGIAQVSGLFFTEAGVYNVTARDASDPKVSGSAENIDVTVRVSTPHIDYRIYDMFEQRWGDWWPWRLLTYKTDVILSNKPHEYTMVYNPDARNLQGIIYAPYRWNTTATGVTSVNVHHPEFMPVMGTPGVPGAVADMHIWFEYLDNETWYGYWKPTWGTNPNWTAAIDAFMPVSGTSGQYVDGYYLGVLYTATMNREAALEWMGMPLADVPSSWWTANGASYMEQWQRWITNEGNVRLDIWPAYEWPYLDLGTMMDLVEESDGDITLRIGHFSWGFESLITRWLNETGICIHEPYMEDFNLSAHFDNSNSDVFFDAVVQYNLHAVKANQTVRDAAWVWEPQRMDYVWYDNPASGYVSEFNPWDPMSYTSWNSGDGYFGAYVPYDFTPQWFNLTDNQTLTIQLPTHNNVIGYNGEGLPTGRTSGAIYQLRLGNTAYYDSITVHGTMWLDWYMTGEGLGAPDLSAMYNNLTKTLTMVGPMNFDNYRHENGLLYHSAPWIEFDVSNGTPADFAPVADAGPDRTVMGGDVVTLNGSMSYDDHGIVNWTWTFDYDGSTIVLYGEAVDFVFWVEGVYNITLTVTDTIGQTDNATVQITVAGMIPEFGSVLMPAVGLAVLLVVVASFRRRRE